MDRVERRGPLEIVLPKLSTSEIVNIFVAVEGEPYEEEIIFRKKVSQCRNTERGTLWGFSTSILSQNIRKLKGGKFLFSEKSLKVPKKTEKGPFGIFQHPFCRKTAKN